MAALGWTRRFGGEDGSAATHSVRLNTDQSPLPHTVGLMWRFSVYGATMKAMANAPPGYVKLRLTGPDGLIETPWAERIGDKFRLDNLPWYAYGI